MSSECFNLNPSVLPEITEDLEELVGHALSRPTVFLVGSGVSIPPPACLPSAWDMINLVVQALAPRDARADEIEAICGALPELFYEALYGTIGPVAVEPWTVLALHTREPSAFPHQVAPNTAHLAIVYLSWRHDLPIRDDQLRYFS